MGSNSSKLHTAALEGNVHVLKILVEKRGVDVETEFGKNNCAICDYYSNKLVVVRAIHVAARHGNHDVVDFLLNNLGACPDPLSGVGDTPLMLAAKYNHLRCIAHLMMAGADPSIENFQGKTSFHIAEESGSFEALPYLRRERTQVPVEDDSERLESIGVYSISSQDIRTFLTSFS